MNRGSFKRTYLNDPKTAYMPMIPMGEDCGKHGGSGDVKDCVWCQLNRDHDELMTADMIDTNECRDRGHCNDEDCHSCNLLLFLGYDFGAHEGKA